MGGSAIMAIKNDDRILELKGQIEEKKKVLAEKKVRFLPETNCVIEFEDFTYNLNVCTPDILATLMIRLNMYIMSAKDLGVPIPVISGYTVICGLKISKVNYQCLR